MQAAMQNGTTQSKPSNCRQNWNALTMVFAPSSQRNPPSELVRIFPPALSAASNTVTFTPLFLSLYAATSPLHKGTERPHPSTISSNASKATNTHQNPLTPEGRKGKERSLTWPRRRRRRPTWRELRGSRRSPPSRGPDVGGDCERRWGDKDGSGTKWRRPWQSERAFELGLGIGWGFACCLVRGSESLEPRDGGGEGMEGGLVAVSRDLWSL